MSEEYEGLDVTGSAIAAMTEDKRYATIRGLPKYEDLPDFTDKSKTVRRLVIQVELSNGAKARYIPNKKSSQFIAGRKGTDFKAWEGVKIYWEVLKQAVAGQMKDVLYVTKVD